MVQCKTQTPFGAEVLFFYIPHSAPSLEGVDVLYAFMDDCVTQAGLMCYQ